MITSKTHEIVVFYMAQDPLILYHSLENAPKLLDSLILSGSDEIYPIKYVQPIGDEWRNSINYGWFLVHGVLIFSDLVKKQALPTIVKSNCSEYLYAEDIYFCPHSDHDILFSRTEHKNCPNCGSYHTLNPNPLKSLWKDFHRFYGFSELTSMGIEGIMKECHKFHYPQRRMDINDCF